MRINAFLARAGIASRRKADMLIKSGAVKINNEVAQLNSTVTDNDKVEVNGTAIQAQAPRYILLNKPVGYMSTLNDPEGRRKVMDLVKIDERVVPVGRLDFNTSGLLLLTNDGLLARDLMHPSSGIEKTYELKIDGVISKEVLNKLSNGVQLEDGMTAKAKAISPGSGVISLVIKEGRNRQVRRMAQALDLKLRRLHRSKYGRLELGSLKPGMWRELTPKEVQDLKEMVQ